MEAALSERKGRFRDIVRKARKKGERSVILIKKKRGGRGGGGKMPGRSSRGKSSDPGSIRGR